MSNPGNDEGEEFDVGGVRLPRPFKLLCLGHFGVSQAERVLSLVDSLSTRVRRQAISARLTLGA